MWLTISGIVIVIGIVGIALWRKVVDIAGIAKEAKEAIDTIIAAVQPDSPGGRKPTAEELAKIFKEIGDVVTKFKGSKHDE